MRLVCFCSKCKQGKPYDMVVILRGDRDDVCVECIADKSDYWVERNVISAHQRNVWEYRNKQKRRLALAMALVQANKKEKTND